MASRILAGPGVHSGVQCRVEMVRRGDDGGGVRFLLPGHPLPLPAAALAGLSRSARRATVLGEGVTALRTPEHLLAALLFFADLPLDVRCEGGEIPILDGSALPFREALSALAPECAARPAWRERPCGLVFEHRWPAGHLSARPAERFTVTYALERPGLRESVTVSSPEEAWEGALPARTWISLREWRQGRAAGLLRGAGPDAGLLLAESPEEHAAPGEGVGTASGPFPLLNAAAWRLPSEAARHKVLDLLGDLALRGLELPALEIRVLNGGHAIHHLLLERLIHG